MGKSMNASFSRLARTPRAAQRTIRACLGMLTVAAVGVGISSCSGESSPVLSIGVPHSPTKKLGVGSREADSLGLYYQHALEKADPETNEKFEVERVTIDPRQRIDDLRSGRIQVTFGCVGELLDLLDAHKGQQLRELYRKEDKPDPAKWRDITHSTMMAALPAGVAASDPGIASICPDETLPQNIVALYDNDKLKRFDRRQLNNVAGGVSTEMLGSERDGSKKEPPQDEEGKAKASKAGE